MGETRTKSRASKLCHWAGLTLITIGAAGWGYQLFRHQAAVNAARLSAEQIAALKARLTGDWVAQNVSSAIGPLKIEMILATNGSCHVNLWTSGPIVAQLRNKDGNYELKGDRIFSELLKRGSCRYWFDGSRLMVEYKEGTIVPFERTGGTGIAQAGAVESTKLR